MYFSLPVSEAYLTHNGSAADPLPETGGEHIGCSRDHHPDHHAEKPSHVESGKRRCTYK